MIDRPASALPLSLDLFFAPVSMPRVSEGIPSPGLAEEWRHE